jgi:hypothetical protein
VLKGNVHLCKFIFLRALEIFGFSVEQCVNKYVKTWASWKALGACVSEIQSTGVPYTTTREENNTN